MRTKVTISIDFGQETSFWQQHAQKQLVDAQGREMKFNSMVDAMNYMGSLGWEFEQAYVVTVGQQNVYHWLMSKLVDEEGAAT
jgi:prophage tail gpP-like protein